MISKYLPKEFLDLLRQGEIAACLPPLRARLEEQFGQYHPFYVAALCAGSELCQQRGQLALALDLSIEAQQRALLVLEPKHPLIALIYQSKGRTLAAQQQQREACYWLGQALEIARIEPELEIRSLELSYAKALYSYKRARQARQLLEERCTRPGSSLEERLLYALSAQADGQSAEALAIITNALPEIPDSSATAERSLLRDALQLLALSSSASDPQAPAAQATDLLLRLELITTDERFSLQLKAAHALFAAGDFESARLRLLELLDERQFAAQASHDDLQDIESMLGEIEFHAKRPELARRHFERALQLLEQLPDSGEARARALHNLGLIALSEQNSQEAIRHLQQAVELRRSLDPLSLAESLLALGFSYKALGGLDDAVNAMAEAHELRQELLAADDELVLQAQEFMEECQELLTTQQSSKDRTPSPTSIPTSADAATNTANSTPEADSEQPNRIQPAATPDPTRDITAAFHHAFSLQQDGNFMEAIKQYEALLHHLEQQRGQSHSDLVPVLQAMSLCFRKLGFEQQALGLEQRSKQLLVSP